MSKGKLGSAERKEVVTVRKTASASEVSAVMEEADVSNVVVTDERGDAPIGVVTDHDLKRCVYGPAPSRKTAEEIMSKRALV
ncbi:MAG: CBS domain-containing protein [Halobacteriales archaeon]|nr:CBS domain-containing protein [Halobacteriales archaeon]